VVVMDKENEDSIHDQKIDEILKKHAQLDDICREIFLTLQAYKRLRFKELQRHLKKFGADLSNQTLTNHLKHLKKQKLISCKRGFQNASYCLTDQINSLLNPPEEDLKEWIETLEEDEKLPEDLRPEPFYSKDYYGRLSEKQLEEKTDKDINRVLTHNLFELKTFINYDLQLRWAESDVMFWNFVGNPLYRMSEKTIVEDCRNSEQYWKKLFEKLDILISKIRPDKELLKKREEGKKNHSKYDPKI
jgi:DNA-binding HxlR family transcriptional regulator